jgi:hypothetical protein
MSEFSAVMGEIRAMNEKVNLIDTKLTAHVAVDEALSKQRGSRAPQIAAYASCAAVVLSIVALFLR